ncbi:hypothetical protein JDV09_10860 [Mycobacterium sp. Y57]|uniref:hypothetical protein n=1 Tax=Mycolicibacterium xanthum TaxID=2796469 RepID=UPI001C847518|nr:hypothetical protein [Mycolicibacterium xanthum]MBX7432599.1 hypothetical protein [Mycolicibacterium xanthum]
MTDQSATIEISHPPEAVLRALNTVLRRALRTPLGAPIGDFMVVGFTGRKTGRRYAVPVSAHRLDGDFYALLNAGWKANFRGGAVADVTYRGKTAPMQGTLISDPAAVGEIAERVATAYGPKKAQRQMGLRFPGAGVPSVAEFTEAAGRLGLVAVKLAPKA